MKRVTRKKVEKWLRPMRQALLELRAGEELYANGYAMTRSDENDTYDRIDNCLRGWVGMIERIWPGRNVEPLTHLMNKLEQQQEVTPHEIDLAMTWIKSIEKPLMLESQENLNAASMVEQIAIEMESLGLVA